MTALHFLVFFPFFFVAVYFLIRNLMIHSQAVDRPETNDLPSDLGLAYVICFLGFPLEFAVSSLVFSGQPRPAGLTAETPLYLFPWLISAIPPAVALSIVGRSNLPARVRLVGSAGATLLAFVAVDLVFFQLYALEWSRSFYYFAINLAGVTIAVFLFDRVRKAANLRGFFRVGLYAMSSTGFVYLIFFMPVPEYVHIRLSGWDQLSFLTGHQGARVNLPLREFATMVEPADEFWYGHFLTSNNESGRLVLCGSTSDPAKIEEANRNVLTITNDVASGFLVRPVQPVDAVFFRGDECERQDAGLPFHNAFAGFPKHSWVTLAFIDTHRQTDPVFRGVLEEQIGPWLWVASEGTFSLDVVSESGCRRILSVLANATEGGAGPSRIGELTIVGLDFGESLSDVVDSRSLADFDGEQDWFESEFSWAQPVLWIEGGPDSEGSWLNLRGARTLLAPINKEHTWAMSLWTAVSTDIHISGAEGRIRSGLKEVDLTGDDVLNLSGRASVSTHYGLGISTEIPNGELVIKALAPYYSVNGRVQNSTYWNSDLRFVRGISGMATLFLFVANALVLAFSLKKRAFDSRPSNDEDQKE
jgi:hypothetical protein